MATQIFKSYTEFLNREDKTINGVSEYFSKENENWEEMNSSNDGCWNCSGCSGCYDCSDCYDCYDCSGCSGCSDCWNCFRYSGCSGKTESSAFVVPIIENIHQKVFEAVTASPKSLEMGAWHTCDTTHCRGGWVVNLAGEAGMKLAEDTSDLFAAMQIYKASSPIRVSSVRFFESNEVALKDIERCANEEKKLATSK